MRAGKTLPWGAWQDLPTGRLAKPCHGAPGKRGFPLGCSFQLFFQNFRKNLKSILAISDHFNPRPGGVIHTVRKLASPAFERCA